MPIKESLPFVSLQPSVSTVVSCPPADDPLVRRGRVVGQIFTPPDMAALMVRLAGIEAGWSGRVLDPACGPGALLRAVADVLEGTEPASDRGGTPGRGIDSELWGADLDERLLGRAATALASGGTSVRLTAGNALTCLTKQADACDVVLANPPYVAWHRIAPEVRAGLASELWQLLPGRPRHADQQPDLALFFLLLGWRCLKPGGRLVYLLPPEWLSAPRITPFRDWLLDHTRLEALITFGPHVQIFEGEAGEAVQTGAMLLVATRALPAPSQMLTWAHLESIGEERASTLQRLAETLRVTSRHPGAFPESDVSGLPDSSVRLTRVAQADLKGRSWQPRPADCLPSSWIELGDVPGLRVVGGHQPRVQWLEWLTVEGLERERLPAHERQWLYPALQEARDIGHPLQPPPSRYWLMVPADWSAPVFQARAPGLYACVYAKLRAALAAQQETKGVPGLPPEGWWHFPNPRNLSLFETGLPGLLLPRTALQLQATWDDHSHSIKGTNTAIRLLDVRHRWRLEALFALLNSQPMRALCVNQTRSYHGRGIRLEPRDVITLRIPPLDAPALQPAWEALRVVAQRVLSGQESLERLSAPAQQLLALAR